MYTKIKLASLYSAWYFWTVILIAIILAFALTFIVMICCRKPEKITSIRISAPIQTSILGISQDEKGMIQPDVVFFRRPSTALSFAQLSNAERRASNNSESLECNDIETIDDMSVRLTTPIKPLSPAYQICEPVNVSRVRLPQGLCENQTDSEFALPPGYVTALLSPSSKI